MFTNQYQQLLELLEKKEKGILNLGEMRRRRTKCVVMVERVFNTLINKVKSIMYALAY